MAAGILLTILAYNLTRPKLELDQADARLVLMLVLAVGLLVAPELIHLWRSKQE